MNKTPKILNKDGTLTKYSFSTGWKEVYKTKSGDKMVITKELNSFCLKFSIGDKLAFCETFKWVGEARNFARRHGKFDHVKLP